jgi:hypothetical protein
MDEILSAQQMKRFVPKVNELAIYVSEDVLRLFIIDRAVYDNEIPRDLLMYIDWDMYCIDKTPNEFVFVDDNKFYAFVY